jgi:hypothetical protein
MGVLLEVLAGELGDMKAPTPPPHSWAADKSNRVAIYNLRMGANSQFTLPATDEGINRTLFLYEGHDFTINDHRVKHYHGVEVDPTVELKLSAQKEAKVLVLQGRPIDEPVVQHGPFVMNTKDEIRQAFVDYQNTQFGGWPWNDMGPVHGTSGRFAKHADGRMEKRS